MRCRQKPNDRKHAYGYCSDLHVLSVHAGYNFSWNKILRHFKNSQPFASVVKQMPIAFTSLMNMDLSHWKIHSLFVDSRIRSGYIGLGTSQVWAVPFLEGAWEIRDRSLLSLSFLLLLPRLLDVYFPPHHEFILLLMPYVREGVRSVHTHATRMDFWETIVFIAR